MANTKTVDLFDFSKVSSVKDFGFKFAQYHTKGKHIVDCLRVLDPGFPDNMTEETKEGLLAGFELYKIDMTPAVRYRKDGHDTYVVDPEGGVEITAQYAMGFTPNELGKLKGESPNLYSIVRGIRDDISKYKSNRLRDLKKMGREPVSGRGTAATFSAYLEKLIEASRTRRNTAESRGEAPMSSKELEARWFAFQNWKPKA